MRRSWRTLATIASTSPRADVAIANGPGVVLTSPGQDLAADPVVRQGMGVVSEQVPEPTDAEAAVVGQRLEGQVWIERSGNDHPLGQHPADLGHAFRHQVRGPVGCLAGRLRRLSDR